MKPKTLAFALVAASALAASPALAERTIKPTAPATLTAAVQLARGGWQVVVDVAPTRDAAAVEIEVAGKRTRFGATEARRNRHVVVPVQLADGAGQDVAVSARVGGRVQTLVVRVGMPAPVVAKPATKPTVTVSVVNGVTIAEVRE